MKEVTYVRAVFKVADNVKRLCDGGFYTQRIFKTAIAKPMLAVRSY